MPVTTIPAPLFEENCHVWPTGQGRCVVVDPGGGCLPALEAHLTGAGLRPAAVLLTHAHPDHVWSAAAVCARWGCPAWIHRLDAPALDDPMAGLGPMAYLAAGLWTSLGLDPADYRPPAPLRVFDTPGGTARLTLDAPPVPTPGPDAGPGAPADGDPRDPGVEVLAVHAPGHTPGSTLYVFDGSTGAVVFTGDVLFRDSIGRTDLPGGDTGAMRRTLRTVGEHLADTDRLFPGHGPSTTWARERRQNPFLVGPA